jgi:DAK2 domain fusion protein YloV
MTRPAPSNEPSPAFSADSPPHTVDGLLLKRLVLASLTWLNTNQQTVNSLNVFPVPDGDTGTNMSLTMQAAYQEIASVDSTNAGEVAHGVAHGALIGARGNSGVILSQIWRGIARSLDAHPVIDAPAFARALREARDTAYKGVVRPVEGTILTVASDIAHAAQIAMESGCPFPDMLDQIVTAADLSVNRTPELLPVLREAGVVDAGGKGLFFLMEGMLRYLREQPLDQPSAVVPPLSALDLSRVEEYIEEGQDYEVVVDFSPFGTLDLQKFYQRLEDMGTSIQLGQGDDIYRLHIHVPEDKRYAPIEYAIEIGTVKKVAIENLRAQVDDNKGGTKAETYPLAPVEPGQIAAVVVSPGAGLTRVFASLGISAVIPGGQTMNPSTQEILSSFADLPTDKIIILPNNGNILMAAQQTAILTDKHVSIVPTHTIPEGIAAMLAFQHEGELEQVTQAMSQAMDGVESGEITRATRSVEWNGVQVSEGQYIGLHNGDLVVVGHTLEEALLKLLVKMNVNNHELITLYWGEDLAAAEANSLADRVRETFPGQDLEIHPGGQPHYHFILSVE